MKAGNYSMRPTREQPLLVGLLVDVSASMGSSIQNRWGNTTTRLESFREALDDLVSEAGELSQEGEKIAPLVRLFAYGRPIRCLVQFSVGVSCM
jgi:hypothetical protein